MNESNRRLRLNEICDWFTQVREAEQRERKPDDERIARLFARRPPLRKFAIEVDKGDEGQER
jgi:hypothetical protein